MLAGCSSSTLLSPRHRLRSEAAAQFQACHFQLPSMNTQRLDLPCTSFSRKETSRAQQPIRPVGVSVEKTIDSKPGSCSLKQNIRLPPLTTTTSVQTPFSEARREVGGEYWKKGKNLKRFVEDEEEEEEVYVNRAKRKKRGSCKNGDDEEDDLSFGQFGGANFWFQPGDFSHPQKVCFVPSEVISSPWVESGLHKITEFGEKEGGEASHCPAKDASDSSNSSGNQSLVLRVNEKPGEEEVGNGSRRNPYSLLQGSRLEVEEFLENQGEEEGFELVSMLAACVEAIRSKNIALINHLMDRLGDLASPQGSSIKRLVSYYTEALALRVSRLWPHMFHITTPRDFDRADDDPGTALRLLNQVSPIPKFIHFTSNEVILRAFEGKDRVHIIDFEIKQGLQWPSLFQSLASRPNPPTHVRITGVGESKQELNETGERLSGFAEALNLPFKFHPVVDRLEDVRLWMLHVKEHECVTVNCVFQLHKMLYDGNGSRAIRDFLGLIRSTNPSAVLIAEQEAYHNDPNLEIRVSNSLKYYSAIFDSFDLILPPDSPVRIKIEEMFGMEIRNVIACEGSQRIERHEMFEKWKKTMEENGFKCSGISERELIQTKILLKMYSCESYNVSKPPMEEDVGALTLNWEEQPLYTVSAWTTTPLQVAGSSSSFSQT